uniref:Chromatin target of PRMT1 protein C-terminal domain-containing protein n=1 Tax=Arcella intermedia TaxID=1963864 RepID=A0A6B2LQQ4_9EUKA
MATRRVIVESTINDRFKKIQESDGKDTRMTTPSQGGVSKPRGRGGRGISARGRGGLNGRRVAVPSSTRGRGGFRGGRGRGGRGISSRGRGRGGRKSADNKKEGKPEDLDKDLENYWLKDEEKGAEMLDQELEDYMSHRDEK